MIAAYVGGASARTDALTLLGTQDLDVDDPMLRLQYGGHAADGRVGDVRERVDAREAADAAEDRAAEDRATAEQAERDAVAAREAAEQHIVDIDAETVATQEDEVEAVADLADREADVLVATSDIAPARLRADVVGEGIDFPLVALDAWVKAAATAPCRLEWWALAGISKVEGRHGTHGGGRLGARGYPSVKIIGPQLNGAGAFAAVGDTDGGRYDEDPVWDRAVGPMQFIPSTWARWGRDGDGDGTADPFTIYDATAGAAAYLCAGRTDLTDEAQPARRLPLVQPVAGLRRHRAAGRPRLPGRPPRPPRPRRRAGHPTRLIRTRGRTWDVRPRYPPEFAGGRGRGQRTRTVRVPARTASTRRSPGATSASPHTTERTTSQPSPSRAPSSTTASPPEASRLAAR